MKKNVIYSLLPLLALILGVTSCNNSDFDETAKTYSDIVTIVSQSDEGAVFTFNKAGDSPLVTLTTTQTLDKKEFKDGSRILLQYSPASGEQYKSDNVKIVSASNIFGSGEKAIVSNAEDTDDWQSETMNVYSLWRSGTYINIFSSAMFDNSPRQYAMYVDEKTLDNEYPELRIIFESDNNAYQNTRYIYASFNIEDLWNRADVKGVKIYNPDKGSSLKVTTISKTDNPGLKPIE